MQDKWSTNSITIYSGDAVSWTWTNLNNLIEVDENNSNKAGGITSGTADVGMQYGYQRHTYPLTPSHPLALTHMCVSEDA